MPTRQTWPVGHSQVSYVSRFAENGAGPANVATAVAVDDLSLREVRDAIEAVAARQPLLRASFDGEGLSVDDRPVVVAGEYGPMTVAQAHRSLEQQAGEVRGYGEPLWTARVLEVPGGRRILGFAFHHLIFDGMSGRVFWEQLRDPGAAPAGRSYREFVEWQRERFGDPGPALEFWRRHLDGLAHNQHTPIRFARRLGEPLTGPSDNVKVVLTGRALRRAVALSRSRRLSLFAVGMSALTVVLADASEAGEAVVRIAFHGRPAGFETTIGVFAHDVTVRLPTVRTSLAAAIETTTGVWAGLGGHRFTPYATVRRAAGASETSHRPVVVTLNARRLPDRMTVLGHPAIPVTIPAPVTEEGLHIAFVQRLTSLELSCSFHPTRFAREDVAAFVGELARVMQGD
ncbi:condensation domain-containing protein [Actinoplanes sp. NPDC051851]|uniref:condensation domain-containing protein n=1 Tax=Actinoplanes sp. NPDC051851 TaxID=3154753 RepID=UPI00341D6440